MCTNMITAALQNRVLRNPAVERWLEIPPRKSEAAAAAAATPAPTSRGVALTNLGMTLKRPKNSLLGTAQSFQPVKPSVPSVPSVPFAKAPLPNATAAFQSGQGGQGQGQSKAGIERLAELSGGRFAVKRMEKQL